MEGMHITRQGPGVYRCQSESDPTVDYHVDIGALDALGQCDCKDFIERRYWRWRRGGRRRLNAYRCKHIRYIRDHVLDQIILFKLQTEHKPNNKSKSYGQKEKDRRTQ